MALRRRGHEHALLAAEGALELRTREQRAELRFASGGEERQAVDGARDDAAVDQFLTGVAEPARELEARLFEAAREPEALPRARRCAVGERRDRNLAELRVDRVRQSGPCGQPQ